LLEATLAFASAKAVQARLPEPGNVQDALAAPLGQFWGEAIGNLRQFVGAEDSPWNPVADALTKWGEIV